MLAGLLSCSPVAEEVVRYFASVSDLLPPLDTTTKPSSCGGTQMEPLTEIEVAELIRNSKKPSSMVPGDILPHLYSAFTNLLAAAVTPIFNKIIQSSQWPQPWKT